MPPFSRNSRRTNCMRNALALGAGIALTLLSGGALADGAHRFVFTAYSDAAGGADVVAGRYQAALEQLRAHRDAMDLDPSAANTNRCVAYSMTLRWQQARAACDAAVRAANEQRQSAQASWLPASNTESLAVAYANRAVVNWLSDDDAAAREDLAKARELSPRAAFVAQNLAALRVHREMARAGAPAPKS
jgi:tetratricopeptide (TPR) repeat protein